MQAIADWLKELGMSEYAQRFAENDIDLSVLPDLTDQDLRELGLSMGHRRRLLRAISELNDTPASPNVIAKSAPPPISASETPAERSGDRSLGRGSRWRAAACHGDVLRSGGLDRYHVEARR